MTYKVINFGTSKMALIHHQNFYVIINLLNMFLERVTIEHVC